MVHLRLGYTPIGEIFGPFDFLSSISIFLRCFRRCIRSLRFCQITYRALTCSYEGPGPFWNITRTVEAALGIERCSCAWTNLNRFDHDEAPPTGDVLEAMPALDFLVREEIRILRPDVVLFYTNRKYDHRLESLYRGVQFSDIAGLPSSHFARLTHPELPILTIRTPHPKTIRIRHWEESFVAYMQSLRAKNVDGA